MGSDLFVETQKQKQLKEQEDFDKTKSGENRINQIERNQNANVGYVYNKFQKVGNKVITDDPVAKSDSEELRTEVTLRRELDAVLRDNELLTHETKLNIDSIVNSDMKRTRLEHLLELTNYLLVTIHDYCVSGEWDPRKKEK